jgi:hypothetical protein
MILTADKLSARNWPCSPTCALCDQAPETAKHLVLHCSLAREVWHRISLWSGGLVQQPDRLGGGRLVEHIACWFTKGVTRPKAAILTYTAWNIYMESKESSGVRQPDGNTGSGRRRDRAGDRAVQESSWRAGGG